MIYNSTTYANKTLLTLTHSAPAWVMGLGFIRGCPPLPQTGAGARVTKLEQREDEVESSTHSSSEKQEERSVGDGGAN